MHIFGIIYSQVNLSCTFYENQKKEVGDWWTFKGYWLHRQPSLTHIDTHTHMHNVFFKDHSDVCLNLNKYELHCLSHRFPSLISFLQLFRAHLRTNTICIQNRTVYKFNGVILGESLKTQYKTFPHSPEMHF